MIKNIAMMKRKPGMSREAFIDRYETVHAPLATELTPCFDAYSRTYPTAAVRPSHIEPAADEPEPIDVITQLWYKDQSALDRMVANFAGPIGERIARDEDDQFDKSHMQVMMVDEYVTPQDKLADRPVGHEGPPRVKMICLLSKKPGMSRDTFIAYYENNHAPLGMATVSRNGKTLFARYARSFPRADGMINLAHIETAPPAPDFDVLTEIWFWNDADYQTFLELMADPAAGAAIAADEEQLFDRAALRVMMTQEYVTPRSVIEAARAKQPA